MKNYNCVKCGKQFYHNHNYEYYNCSHCLIEFYRFRGREAEFEYMLKFYSGGRKL